MSADDFFYHRRTFVFGSFFSLKAFSLKLLAISYKPSAISTPAGR